MHLETSRYDEHGLCGGGGATDVEDQGARAPWNNTENRWHSPAPLRAPRPRPLPPWKICEYDDHSRDSLHISSALTCQCRTMSSSSTRAVPFPWKGSSCLSICDGCEPNIDGYNLA